MKVQKCRKPPGGEVVCEDHQFAICEIQSDGTVRASCLPPPTSNRLAMFNWALEIVTGVRRHPEQELTARDRQILDDGEHVRPDGVVLTFSLPRAQERSAAY